MVEFRVLEMLNNMNNTLKKIDGMTKSDDNKKASKQRAIKAERFFLNCCKFVDTNYLCHDMKMIISFNFNLRGNYN